MTYDPLPGHLILFVSVPGGGKSVLIKHLHEIHPELQYAISCTSRPMRPGEVDGGNYYFLSPEEFQQRIDNDEFLEWVQIDGGRYYGTLKSEIVTPMEAGEVVVREVEIQGARNIKAMFDPSDVSIIFILPGSWEEMAERMKARAPISDEELAHRKERYEAELPFQSEADYVIMNENGKLDAAKAEMERIVTDIITNTAR